MLENQCVAPLFNEKFPRHQACNQIRYGLGDLKMTKFEKPFFFTFWIFVKFSLTIIS